jgi:hypothetical protein
MLPLAQMLKYQLVPVAPLVAAMTPLSAKGTLKKPKLSRLPLMDSSKLWPFARVGCLPVGPLTNEKLKAPFWYTLPVGSRTVPVTVV